MKRYSTENLMWIWVRNSAYNELLKRGKAVHYSLRVAERYASAHVDKELNRLSEQYGTSPAFFRGAR